GRCHAWRLVGRREIANIPGVSPAPAGRGPGGIGMNDLRRDINEVFAKQQGQLGDVAGAGNRMLRAATAGRRINRQLWPSVAGVALVLVAAAAIRVLIVVRGLHSRNVVTNNRSLTPIASPAPTTMSQRIQVP